jgi:hypothetical protein
MSTLTARRAARVRRCARLRASNKCQCGQPMDRLGDRCQQCTDHHALMSRQRYRKTEYGAAFTCAVIQRSSALEMRGLQ